MTILKRVFAALLLVVLLAAPASTQIQPTRQQLNQQARQVWQQCDVFRSQGKFKEAKTGYDALIQAYGTLNMPRFVEASRQMSEVCASMPIDVKKLKDGTYTGTAKGYETDLTLEITVKTGKLTDLRVVQQKESRPGNVFDSIPKSIIKSQTPSIDGVTGATITSAATMCAARRALARAQTPAARKP